MNYCQAVVNKVRSVAGKREERDFAALAVGSALYKLAARSEN